MSGHIRSEDDINFLENIANSHLLLSEEYFSEELFSMERMEEYARELSQKIRVTEKSRRPKSLRPVLKNCEKKLNESYAYLSSLIQQREEVTPAAEWFVDNFHLIEKQLREIKFSLPDDYYNGLPQLADGSFKGFPRAYYLAIAYMAHRDSHIEQESFRRFLYFFQEATPLKIGELWALVISLRIVLVQHITILSELIMKSRLDREKGNELAEKVLEMVTRNETNEKELQNYLSSELPFSGKVSRPLLVQLTQRLRDQEANVWPASDWIEKKLGIFATSTDRIISFELRRQASAQVTVGNILTSIHYMNSLDWREFIENVNIIDPILARDPSGAYPLMNFQTRDTYRHVLEGIAKGSKISEFEAAQRLLKLAEKNEGTKSHIGYFLVDKGRREFEKECGYKPAIKKRMVKFILKHPTVLYLSCISLLTLAMLSAVLYYYKNFSPDALTITLIALLALFPASELALSFVNHYVTYFKRPVPLPRMDFERGIPESSTSMVVIPTLFTRPEVIDELVQRLEIHYLSNNEPHVTFALLGDFADAQSESTPADRKLIDLALKRIDELNAKYPSEDYQRFHVFIRKRLWNKSEGAWIGWERKRGKLLEFNQLLRGAKETTYIVSTASPDYMQKVKYVITLDSDTQLPREGARKLIETISHPLNQPEVDHHLKRVVSGYGMLQPRISVTAESAEATWFARLSSGNIGIDPYTTAVSDVYQDLFHEGSFTGKGLYVVDAFEESMENRVPENTVLSHDLFEGSYARCALVTDVELFDDYPADYDTFSKRNHRWTRGDWQLFPWLFSKVRDAQGKKVRNDLSFISRWKIFDNLRRSLVPIATLIFLVLSWTFFPGSAFIGSTLILLMYLFPVYSTVATGDWMRLKGVTWHGHFLGGWKETKIKLGQILLTVAFLPKQAWVQADAIVRAFYRVYISKKNLLEWTSFANLKTKKGLGFEYRDLLDSSPVIAVSIGIMIGILRPEALPASAHFLVLWFMNPWIKILLRQVPPKEKMILTPEDAQDYRTYARSTWHFFETFVTENENWLAPDNFQEDPAPVIAHRTSPTNIGLQLLAGASAYDFGYIGKIELLELYERTISTLDRMQTMHGHFFNWYDTLTLEPLQPRYISTVDSGNLAGHLITFRQFLLELKNHPSDWRIQKVGIIDTIRFCQRTGAHSKNDLKDLYDKCIELNTEGEWKKFVGEAWKNLKAKRSDEKSSLLRHLGSLQRDHDETINDLDFRLEELSERCFEMAMRMDFKFLFDEKKKLFVIGFNVNENRLDNSYYDLLASESRLPSFMAIAKNDVPQEHWFRLGRQMTPVGGARALVAWTATMFEYLMPLLVMKRFDQTLLEETYKTVVRRQIDYGYEKNVPWGISEAGYNARDLQMNYQYGPFGVPGLGLKRGLADDLVISPYSTMLAAMIDPLAALSNLRRLMKLGAYSLYGFYEAVDFTKERVPAKKDFVILKSYMAHHQGMGLVAINNVLNDSVMQKRFHSDRLIQSAELLLQERAPKLTPLKPIRMEEVESSAFLHSSTEVNPRLYSDVNLSLPRTQILSNGTYSVMLTSTGAGYSKCGPVAIHRWREDTTRDQWGQFIYLRNRSTNKFWSVSHQPTQVEPSSFGVTFSEEKVEYWRRDGSTLVRTEIIVSPVDNIEMRRVTITNESAENCDYELTSYVEAIMAKPNDDTAHPAFQNLFVQTEYVGDATALLATRRARSNKENPQWCFHSVTMQDQNKSSVQYETDRSRFLGRGRNVSNPMVIEENKPLSNSVGSVLDPVFSLRQPVTVPAGKAVSVIFMTGLAPNRDDAVNNVKKYHDPHMFVRSSEIAWTHSQVQLRYLNISNAKAHTYQRLAGRVIYLDSSLRPSSKILGSNTRAQTNLWTYGISGDLPIILTEINDEKDMSMVRELLKAHEYLRLKGLSIDLVILNEKATSYLQTLQDEIYRIVRVSGNISLLDKPGGIFLRRSDIMPQEDVTLLKTVARVILKAEKGSLEEQLKYRKPQSVLPSPLVMRKTERSESIMPINLSGQDLEYYNGIGGFTKDSKEYVITLNQDQWTPAPWINVIANSHDFGFIVSESGSGFTWSVNSRENRITPWSNDPVSDPPGEVIYLRDEETGEVWTPTPLPMRSKVPYLVRHGQGYTSFAHHSHGLNQELTYLVSLEHNVKIGILKLRNDGASARKISLTNYIEWVLGFHRSTSSSYIIPEFDKETSAIMARNPYNNEFASRISFVAISETNVSFTCDRREFLGRNGSPGNPAALKRTGLTNTSGAGLDPCGVLQAVFDLAPGEEKTLLVLLGQADSMEEARNLVTTYRSLSKAEETLDNAKRFWDETLSTINIRTPDRAMDILVNRWLLYQTISCRVWARSAFYQSGGAFGFRDQLQDVMAAVYSHPEITRSQILTAAARQFKEGDVQHWWHPPTGRGVRTHFSDDLIWLPFVTSYYIKVTGDRSILDEKIPFIEAEILKQGQEDSYTHPTVSQEVDTIFEHCARTLDRSLATGVHGLPLMGAGDWNDGMNRVGHEGHGESVWVAWFLSYTLKEFLPYCHDRDHQRAARYENHLTHLKNAVEGAWDGDWYRRAYFDDGTPLGSAINEECKIDSISQSWSVLSGLGDRERAQRAMNAVDEYLVRRGDGLIQLFTPPFDKTHLDPGYIKGYVPGVRENGGQYTHAAIWTVMAFAELGDGEKATELYALLNPINHSSTRAGLHKYKVEPYVVAADIYGQPPHTGRGGWTWYTGSASWMYRSAIENILGLEIRSGKLRVRPQIPHHWQDFEISIVYRNTRHLFRMKRGEKSSEEWFTLKDDGGEHVIDLIYEDRLIMNSRNLPAGTKSDGERFRTSQ